jgi:hypothetical protein
MAELGQDPALNAPADPPDRAAGSAVPDPRDTELAELREYARNAQATFGTLKAYEDDIKAIVEGDDDFRQFQRTSRESYYDMRKRQEQESAAAIPPEQRYLLDEIDKRLKPALEEVDELRKERSSRTAREAEAAKEATQKFVAENTQYAERLAATQGFTSEEIMDLSRFAKAIHDETVQRGEPRFVGLEEAYKRMYSRIEAKQTKATPRSLRATSGAPGIPGASKPADAKPINPNRPGDFTKYMTEVLNKGRSA